MNRQREILILGALVIVAMILMTAWRATPPAPLHTGEQPSRFSGWAAKEILDSLLSEGYAHPIGTPENQSIRDNIVFRLRTMGYQPEVQKAFACRPWGACGWVENIAVRLAGRNHARAVLVAAHYDSVPAGPGASDDGSGVAIILELARLFHDGSPPLNDIVFLIDDGEEAGLLGAQAFVDQHRWASDVGAVVNLEARGTSGLSYMFETSGANEWLIDRFASAAHRPATSSLFYSIYERLPNDTDLTVFKESGTPGLNFAFIGEQPHYHTPLDNVENANPGSLQHQGDNAYTTVGVLANSDLSHQHQNNAVWFDVFGFGVIAWSQPVNRVLSLFAVALFLGAVVVMRTRGRFDPRGAILGTLLWPVTIAGGAAILWLFLWVTTALSGLPSGWIAHPSPLLAAAWLAAFVLPPLLSAFLGRRLAFQSIWSAAMFWFCGLSILCAWTIPGLTFLFLVPVLLGAVIAILSEARREEGPLMRLLLMVIPMIAAALVLFPVAWTLYDAMGVTMLPGITLLTGMVSWFLIPLLRDLPFGRPANCGGDGGNHTDSGAAGRVSAALEREPSGTSEHRLCSGRRCRYGTMDDRGRCAPGSARCHRLEH